MRRKKSWKSWMLLLLLFGLLSAPVCTARASYEAVGTAGMLAAAKKSGWVKSGSYWYYYSPSTGRMLKSQWLNDGGKRYYLGANGRMYVGWKTIDGKKYYFESSGAMHTGWQKHGDDWYYLSVKDGAMIQKKLVHNSKGKYYYFLADGKMATGFTDTGKYVRYFDPSSGKMVKGWLKVSGKWYYFNGAGVRKSGLLIEDGKRYFFQSNGVLTTGWFTHKGERYYADKNGVLATGWVTSSAGNTYHFSSTGKQDIGMTKINGNWYFFHNKHNGIMAVDCWVSGKYFDKNGVWQKDKVEGVNFRWPLASRWNNITSYFGGRESPGGIGSTNHMGIDIAATTGTPIYAAESGTMVVRQYSSSAGYYIEINHGSNIISQYMHMSKFAPAFDVGSSVKKGDVIGYVGSTGNSTGPHLHFGVKRNGTYQDPLNYVDQP